MTATLPRWTAAAALGVLITGLLSAPASRAIAMATVQNKTFPNSACLDTSVPLYSPDMWDAADGTAPEADIGIANWGSNTQNRPAGSRW